MLLMATLGAILGAEYITWYREVQYDTKRMEAILVEREKVSSARRGSLRAAVRWE